MNIINNVKILVCGNAVEIDLTKDLGANIEIVYHKNEWDPVDKPEIFDIVVCNNLFKYNSIELFSKVRFIQLTCAGIDRVPLDYIMKKGIRVCNAKGIYSIPIAEYTIARILEWYKKLQITNKAVSQHQWEKQRNLLELSGKTITIYGYGDIGKAIATRLKSFDAKIIGVSRCYRKDDILDMWINPIEMDGILKKTDIFIITAPLTQETKGFVNKALLDKLKKSSLIVNVSRGAIINIQDLIERLKKGKISGAILDVFEDEPLSPDSDLWNIDNLIISPHNSFEGEGNIERLEKLIVSNIIDELRII